MTGTILTKEGMAELESELLHLETVRRQEVAKRIEEARSFGDLSENSEYDDAKNEQGWIESRIAELKHILDGAQVAELPKRISKVCIGTSVTLKALDGGREVSYNIVGSAEAESTKGNISNESPIGSAICGRQKGDIVTVVTPRGEKKFEIVSVGAAK
ncbi:MAG: transcription elongation factor GreA [Coriobacteriia bacterium]|nr:transcription elongation factor GreA [Coriobacteriia bacterium]